jgi:predicted DNA-binding protein YlxM (UPF0122 family)
MSTIYKLNFATGDFYIGQTSQPVTSRITQHKSTKGSGCPLLATAWQYSEFTGHEILEDNIPTSDLDAREVYWIDKLKPTLNTLPGGKSMRGLNHPRAKYTKEQIEQVLALYLGTALSYGEIAETTLVEYGTVHDILKQRSHAWVWETIPNSKLELARQLRAPQYRVYDKHNKVHEYSGSIPKFARVLGITTGQLNSILNGSESQTGISMLPHPVVELTNPLDEVFTLTLPEAREMLEQDDLSPYQIRSVLTQTTKSSAGWSSRLIHSTADLLERKNSVE